MSTQSLGTTVAVKPKPLSQMSEEELRARRKQQEEGRRWNVRNPVHPDNIIAHWNSATPSEKSAGMDWYADAHHMTSHVATDTGHDMVTAAGLMSNYSPQTHWATNIMNAAKAMRVRRGIGGPGSGVMASAKQRVAADRMMGSSGYDQEHYEQVLGGPKTKAFARLIHHGGNADPDQPDVVIDRHALSVAAGARATDSAYEQSGLGGKRRYAQVADCYHRAATHISKHSGVKVEAHQVQAATWLVRQRLNGGEDKRMASHAQRGRDATEAWNTYAGEHHPLVMGKEPGTGYAHPKDAPEDVEHSQDLHDEGSHGAESMSRVPPTNPRRKPRLAGLQTEAIGETKAPSQVDTLREESCPVCGESEAYDGDQCKVCGFVTPPSMFRDPDLDKAKMMDLRADPASGAPNDQQHELAPVDPEAVDADGAIEGTDATTEDQDTDGDGTVDVETRSLSDEGDEDEPIDEADLNEDGEVSPEEAEVAEQQAEVDQDAEEVAAEEDAKDGGTVSAPVDPDAATGRIPQGGDRFQPGPDAPTPAEPMRPGEQAETGQEVTEESQVPGNPGDAIPDLLCPSCGFEGEAASPTSTPGSPSAPADQGDGLLAGAVCPNCQGATMMSTGEINAMTGVPK